MNVRSALASRLLLVAGATMLATVASHVWTGVRAQSASPLFAGGAAGERLRTVQPARTGDPLGRLSIPRVGLSVTYFEGVTESVLRKGPGHLPGSPCPGLAGETGNCVIAGHRDSFFRRLRNARKGDVVFLSGPAGERKYRLARRRIVRPEETGALAPRSAAQLTLLTCYPFGWLGAAPYRLLWEAVEIDGAASKGSSTSARAADGTRAPPAPGP